MTTAPTLLGMLVRHREHQLRSYSRYVTEPGHVYGQPHVLVDCDTCGVQIWDEGLGETEAGYYTIRDADVGRAVITAWGRRWSVSDFMGRILPSDVGKRINKITGGDGGYEFLQVENNEQFQRRMGRLARERAAGRAPIVTRPLIRTRNQGTS